MAWHHDLRSQVCQRQETELYYLLSYLLTHRVRTDGVYIHSEQRDRDKGSVASQAQHGITQLERCLVLIRVPLVEVDVYEEDYMSVSVLFS